MNSHSVASNRFPFKLALSFLYITHAFIHQYCCVSFRYARYAKHGRAARGVGAEPQDGVRWTSLEDGRAAEATEDPAQGRKGTRPKIILTLT